MENLEEIIKKEVDDHTDKILNEIRPVIERSGIIKTLAYLYANDLLIEGADPVKLIDEIK